MSGIFVYLEDAPPRCLSAFDAVLAEHEGDDYTAAATFAIRCKSCGGDTFHLRTITRLVKDGGARVHIGLRSKCARCARDEVLFDATRSGYDGEFGHLSYLAGEDTAELVDGVGDNPVQVNVQFLFNTEVPELLVHARKLGRGPEDFFDGVSVSCRVGGGSWREVWDFECS